MTSLPLRAWLVALAIFLLGAAAGGVTTAWVGARALRESVNPETQHRGHRERAVRRIGAEMTRKLELTPEESRQVQEILDQTAAGLRGHRQEMARESMREFRQAARRIAAVLPPEKRDAFQHLLKQRFRRLGLEAPASE